MVLGLPDRDSLVRGIDPVSDPDPALVSDRILHPLLMKIEGTEIKACKIKF
jgi:hypothetical protein